jgi:hypothetical protein
MDRDTTSGLAHVAEVPWSADLRACGEACIGPHEQPSTSSATPWRLALLTGGRDRPYALGLASALLSCGVAVDFVGGDTVDGHELQGNPRIRVVSLRDGSRPDAGVAGKIWGVLLSYVRVLRYAASTEAPQEELIVGQQGSAYVAADARPPLSPNRQPGVDRAPRGRWTDRNSDERGGDPRSGRRRRRMPWRQPAFSRPIRESNRPWRRSCAGARGGC